QVHELYGQFGGSVRVQTLMLLMEGRQRLRQRGLGQPPVWHRHRELISLISVTQVSKTLQTLRLWGDAFLSEPGTRVLLEVTESQVEGCQVKGVMALQHGTHVIIFDVA